MDKKEQHILNMIEEKTADVPVPESLTPDRMAEKLEQMEKDGRGKKKRRRLYQSAGLAAACIAAAAGIYLYGYRDHRETSAPREREVKAGHTITSAESYEEIYKYMEAYNDSMYQEEGILDLFSTSGENADTQAEASADSATTYQSGAGEAKLADGGGYSTTNTRQQGVDEADIVKTDGTYLYVLSDNGEELSIVDTREGMKEAGKISSGEKDYIEEFYVLPEEKKLVLICSYKANSYGRDIEPYTPASDVYADNGRTTAVTYDISDAANPKKAGSIAQSGYYDSSRISDGHLYMFSRYYSAWGNIQRNDPKTYVPMVEDEVIANDDIFLPPFPKGCDYEVVTAVDLAEPDEISDSKAIFTTGGSLYVSNQHIYYYEQEWKDYSDTCTTTIRKIAYHDGKLEAKGQGSVKGYINDSFSIDEYDGYLRVVTTAGDEENIVYVLDEKLKTAGKIKDLAPGERVYSARFFGDTGYFVTFRETDPLFSVDFSDPEHPKILGKLKIPGFSEYLHFYGENRLLGIGMDVDAETQVTEGVKLSMFDISDKGDVKETDTYVIENLFGTDVAYDYKGVLVDVGKNLIGFAGYADGGQKYYLFSYDDGEGFQCLLEEATNGKGIRAPRGLYIGEVLYVVEGNIIEAYSLQTYEKIDDLIL